MPIAPHIKRLRDLVGSELLMLPGIAAVVRDADGRVLLHRRSDDGNWALPAGAIDPGETPATAVVREVDEETGLHVRPDRVLGVFGWPRLRHRYPNGDVGVYLVVVFGCTIIGGALEARDGESIGFRWCNEELATPSISRAQPSIALRIDLAEARARVRGHTRRRHVHPARPLGARPHAALGS